MNYKKVFLIITFPILANLIMGCCECVGTFIFNYTNCSISLENLDNSGQEPVESSSNTILKAAFGLRVEVERKKDICAKDFKPLFISSTYATSCDCPPEETYQPLDSIVSIKIVTLRDFDSAHLGNDPVSEYFSILRSTEFVSIDEFILSQQYEFYDISNSTLSFDLMLMTPPEKHAEYQFEVLIELSDGRVLSKISDLVELI